MYEEPESAWAKVVKLTLQGQVTAGCSRLSEKTSRHSLRGLWGKGNEAFCPKAAEDEEFKINCKVTPKCILFLVADIMEIIFGLVRNFSKNLPGVI